MVGFQQNVMMCLALLLDFKLCLEMKANVAEYLIALLQPFAIELVINKKFHYIVQQRLCGFVRLRLPPPKLLRGKSLRDKLYRATTSQSRGRCAKAQILL